MEPPAMRERSEKTILVVEDEPMIAMDIEDMLSALGHRAMRAATGELAIELARRQPPDLALMDIKLPGALDGVDTAGVLVSQYDIPVIFITAYADDALLKRARNIGPLAYLLKPFREEELKATLEIALHKHRMERLLAEKNRQLEAEIQERRRMEDALIEARHAADAASRAKSDFLALMSQELRAPINVILGNARLLERSGLPEARRNQASVIRQSGDHLLALMEDILDLARIEAGRLTLSPAPFHLIGLLNTLADIHRLRASEKDIAFSLAPSPDLPPRVIGDARRLRQILLNLLSNAFKLTPSGRVTLAAAPERDRVIFTVSDTGIGVPEDHRDRIFDPFHQVRENGAQPEGAGLGLSISRQLARMMGGELTLTPAPGGGSVFCFSAILPPADAQALEAAHRGKND